MSTSGGGGRRRRRRRRIMPTIRHEPLFTIKNTTNIVGPAIACSHISKGCSKVAADNSPNTLCLHIKAFKRAVRVQGAGRTKGWARRRQPKGMKHRSQGTETQRRRHKVTCTHARAHTQTHACTHMIVNSSTCEEGEGTQAQLRIM